jgi:hypothetical protein
MGPGLVRRHPDHEDSDRPIHAAARRQFDGVLQDCQNIHGIDDPLGVLDDHCDVRGSRDGCYRNRAVASTRARILKWGLL